MRTNLIYIVVTKALDGHDPPIPYEFIHCGKSDKIRFHHNNQVFNFFLPRTPSNHRAHKNARARLLRILSENRPREILDRPRGPG